MPETQKTLTLTQRTFLRVLSDHGPIHPWVYLAENNWRLIRPTKRGLYTASMAIRREEFITLVSDGLISLGGGGSLPEPYGGFYGSPVQITESGRTVINNDC